MRNKKIKNMTTK